MQLVTVILGPAVRHSGFKGDKLAYDSHDMIHVTHGVLGAVHTAGYNPRWAFHINQFRWRYMGRPVVRKSSPFDLDGLARMLFDGAAWDTKEEATAVAASQVDRFVAKLAKLESAVAA